MKKHFLVRLARQIKTWGRALGFSEVRITDTELHDAERRFNEWTGKGYHAQMGYMVRHGTKRSRPDELVPGTRRIITVRMDYLHESIDASNALLQEPDKGYISRYALGRDYHKIMRQRLQKLADRIIDETGQTGYRAFCDSAPVLEKALAEKSGLGWIGKHTNLINSRAGSWFFLGELFTDLPLPVDAEATAHCGSCHACIDICPTQAIIAPYVLDARKCISYHTIELHGKIPVAFRKAIGNRIYGCDDCQLVCPWNKFAQASKEMAFATRHKLNQPDLVILFKWTEADFLACTEGSAIRRLGHERWLRNIAVALGNAPTDEAVIASLQSRQNHPSEIVREHVAWALAQHSEKTAAAQNL